MSHDEWIDDNPLGEALGDNFARGGHLSRNGRDSAISAALPLVGRYFQRKGGAERLRAGTALEQSDTLASAADAKLIAGLRLRACLGASEQLIKALEEISVRPTFRYALTKSESIGELRGTLDISRLVGRLPISGEPPIYPIVEVRRSTRTPENMLAAFAAIWMGEELSLAVSESGAPGTSPEALAADDYSERFRAVLASPSIRDCRDHAFQEVRRGDSEPLMNRVEERLRRGEVANPDAYDSLHRLMRTLQKDGPTGLPGGGAWSFYDESFDARLFELWCLAELARGISEMLEVDYPAVNDGWVGAGLTFKWQRPIGTLEIYCQRSLSSIDDDYEPQWRRPLDNRKLQGIPDIIVRAVRHDGAKNVAILDAKLRQRDGPPTEELYKVLGYFHHFDLSKRPRGAILFHSPVADAPVPYVYNQNDEDGMLIATALNPANAEQARAGLKPVAKMVINMLGDVVPSCLESVEEESVGGVVVLQRLAELRAIATTLAPQTLEASRKRLEAVMGEGRWGLLDNELQTMLATAEHVGFYLHEDADFSGPVLGLVAPIESLLHTKIIDPARRREPAVPGLRRMNTLGGLVEMIKNAVEGGNGDASRAIRDALTQIHVDPAHLALVMPRLEVLNVDFRRPAAHKEILSERHWRAAYAEILGDGALMKTIVRILCGV